MKIGEFSMSKALIQFDADVLLAIANVLQAFSWKPSTIRYQLDQLESILATNVAGTGLLLFMLAWLYAERSALGRKDKQENVLDCKDLRVLQTVMIMMLEGVDTTLLFDPFLPETAREQYSNVYRAYRISQQKNSLLSSYIPDIPVTGQAHYFESWQLYKDERDPLAWRQHLQDADICTPSGALEVSHQDFLDTLRQKRKGSSAAAERYLLEQFPAPTSTK